MGISVSDFRKRGARLRFILLFFSLIITATLAPHGFHVLPGSHRGVAHAGKDHSDLNSDGVVDLQDLILFSNRFLGLDWQTVDWCQWIQDPDNIEKYGDKYRELFDFISTDYQCDQSSTDRLAVVNQLLYPTRLALGPDGKLYVSDAKVGSVFIYDTNSNLVGELKDLNRPLGIAVDDLGNFYVGTNGNDSVQVYDPTGMKLRTIGWDSQTNKGTIFMPNDIAFDQFGYLYVVDSQSNAVLKFDSNTGDPIGSIGESDLRFPIALEIVGGELYVADQGNNLVRVYDLQGILLRSFGGNVSQGMLGYKWQGRFVRLQSIAFDGQGRIHALDSHMCRIQILDAVSGAYIVDYGTEGTGPGQLRLPFAITINSANQANIADAGNKRIEIISIP